MIINEHEIMILSDQRNWRTINRGHRESRVL